MVLQANRIYPFIEEHAQNKNGLHAAAHFKPSIVSDTFFIVQSFSKT